MSSFQSYPGTLLGLIGMYMILKIFNDVGGSKEDVTTDNSHQDADVANLLKDIDAFCDAAGGPMQSNVIDSQKVCVVP